MVQFDREASQTRGYCVAKNATHRAARPDPSPRKVRLFRMTIDKWRRRNWPKTASGRKKDKFQIAGFNITSVTLVFGEFFKLTSPEEAEN